MRELSEQDRQALMQSDENYYNSKRANSQSFQNFIRILIGAFLGAFLVNTSWNSLHYPFLAYMGTAFLLLCIILNIITYLLTQESFEQHRDATHKAFNEKNPKYIEKMPRIYEIEEKLSIGLIVLLILSIIICPTSYIIEHTLAPKEVKQVPEKQQPTEQPSEKVDEPQNEKLWNKPSRPITPTPDAPAEPPAEPAEPAQPESQPPAEPASDPKPSAEKEQ